MSDEKPETDEIRLTPRERAVVNAAMELADGFAALTYGTPAEAAEHFATAERWSAVAELEQRCADIARDAALSAAMSSLAAGGIAAADGDNEAARDHFAAAERWTAVAKQAGTEP